MKVSRPWLGGKGSGWARVARRSAALALLLAFCLSFLLAGPASALTSAQHAAAMEDLETLAGFASLEENFPALLEVARRGLALEPDNAAMINHLLRAYRGLNQTEQAIQFLRELWAVDAKRFAYLRFEAGYIRMDAREYEKALVHFRNAEEVDRQRALQEQVIALLAMGNLDQALAVAERMDVKTSSSWLTTGQILLLKKDFPGARKAFEAGLAANPDAEESKTLLSRLEMVRTAERAARPWRLYLTMMAQYEDNVFRDPLESNPTTSPTRKKGDMSWLTKLDFDYALWRGDHAAFGFTSQLQTLQYSELRDANFSSMGLGVYWEYQTPSWGFRLPVEYGYFLAKAPLFRKVEVTSLLPSLRLTHSDNWRTDIFGLIQYKKYLDQDPNVFATRLGVIHYLSTDASLRRHLRLGYAASQDQAADSQSGYVTGEVSLGASTPVWGPFSLDLSVTYVKYWYDDRIDPFIPDAGATARKDDQYRALAQLFYRVNDSLMLILGYSHTFNDSALVGADGYDPYDFKRNMCFLLLSWAF